MAIVSCGLVLFLSSHWTPVRHLPRGAAQVSCHAQQIEAYLSPQQVAYSRPGLKMTLHAVIIPEDRRPVVEVAFSDEGRPAVVALPVKGGVASFRTEAKL
ncbi:MAG: hypothetical protein ACUVRY_03870 [Thermoanaerobaculaceae bacterium]